MLFSARHSVNGCLKNGIRRLASTAASNAAKMKRPTGGTIKTVTVIGSGLMGSGIALTSAMTGHSVSLVDVTQEILNKNMGAMRESLDRVVKKKFKEVNTSEAKRFIEESISNIKPTTDLKNAVSNCDIVVEAIVEDLEKKQKLFAEVDSLAAPNTVFATNTSALSVQDIAACVARQELFGGLHFFNPVPIMPLVEVTSLDSTAKTTTDILMAFVNALGKTPVKTKDTPGFIVNRLLLPYMYEAMHMVDRGDATKEDVDVAMKLGASYIIGPFELADYVGLDTLKFVMDSWLASFPSQSQLHPPPTLDKLVAEGKLGKKTGEGFYRHPTAQ